MGVKSNILITQFDTTDQGSSVREVVLSISNEANVREFLSTLNSSSLQTHQPAVTQPAATTVSNNWSTPLPTMDYWSDSPNNDPDLLYRRRFSWGRDEKEVFLQPPKPGHLELLPVASPGIRWGNLDSTAGVLLYQRFFSTSSHVYPIEFHVKGQVVVRDVLDASEETFSIHELGEVVGEVTVQERLFILNALPVPGSIKNPTSTDIYIRLGNLTHTIDPNTFVLFIDGVAQTILTIAEFFSGLGGYDVTWVNSSTFSYGSQVDVRWEFSDTDSPTTPFVVSYPFYIVEDTVGPRVSELTPGDLAVDVPNNNTLQFQVEDPESGVDIDSLVLYVNNIKAPSSSITTTELVNGKGYVVVYTPVDNWLYGDLIPVSIFINDKSKDVNETFYSYSFTTVESTSPRLINLRPLVCSVDVPTKSNVSVDIVDAGHGLDKESIVLTVGNVDRGGQILLIPIIHRDE